MKELIEDYKRRLVTITEVIETTTDTGSINDIAKMARLKAKQSEYRTFIAELERSYRDYIKQKIISLLGDYNADTHGGGSGGILRAMIMLLMELAKDMGLELEVDFVTGSYKIKENEISV